MSEYTERAEQFLKSHGLEFRSVLIGLDCPPFCKDAETETDLDKLDVFPRKTHIHGKHYRCTISGPGRGHVSFDFWNSYADSEENAFNFGGELRWNEPSQSANYEGILTVSRENKYWDKYRGKRNIGYSVVHPRGKRKTVAAYDLLACIQKSEVSTFENFCADFGYDSDSRKAEQTYHAVAKEWKKVQQFFTKEEIAQLQKIS